ncbi:phage protease [Oscillibacter sp.]|uniref:phage protease n=1 Tax=Oscillibacter sp. TaxID=1945593 RepID=UPI0028A9D181|nr:phage protease [Oscillibacter sp.]
MKDFIVLKGSNVEVTGAPEIIPIIPLGHVTSSKGDFEVDTESLRAMKAMIAQRGVDLVVDYEHQTLAGVQAPAAGWVQDLSIKDGYIVAKVQWTPKAAQYLENKEYRYISPVVNVRKSDKKAMGLHSLALTNTPAIEDMKAIVNSDTFEEQEGGQNNMELMQKIAQLLGLGEDAPPDQIMEALTAALNDAKALKEAAAKAEPPAADNVVANKAVCELLDLKAGAAADDVAAKIMELKSGKIGGTNVLEELKALKQHNAERAADDAVTLALKAGKITPAQQDWARSYALSDPEGFGSFVEKAPQIVPLGEIEMGDVKALKSDTLDEATLLACKQLGVSAEDAQKFGLGKE